MADDRESRPQPRLNRHATGTRGSGIRQIANLVAERRQTGLAVYPFHLGEPDFETPESIKQAAVQALGEGATHYTPNAGIAPLRAGIAQDLNDRYSARVEENDVVVTVGSCEALMLALLLTLEPGDDILVPTPCWPNYLQIPSAFGASAHEIAMSGESGFAVDIPRLEAAIGPRTRAVIVNSPNNPTGAIVAAKTQRALLDLARRRGLWLIIDEIYQDIVFDGSHTGILALAQPEDPVLYVGGFSKSYAMTGWRVGYLVARGGVAKAGVRLHQLLVTSVTSFAQWGALQALSERASVSRMRDAYQERRDRVVAVLEDLGFEFSLPSGSFYVFPKVPSGFHDASAFCDAMLTGYGVAMVPGSVFGEAHADRFRLCFACDTDLLEQGLVALAQGIGEAASLVKDG